MNERSRRRGDALLVADLGAVPQPARPRHAARPDRLRPHAPHDDARAARERRPALEAAPASRPRLAKAAHPPLLPAGLRFYFIGGGLIGLSRQLPLLADLRFVLAIEGVPKELLGDVQLLQSWLGMLAQMHGVDTQATARTSP